MQWAKGAVCARARKDRNLEENRVIVPLPLGAARTRHTDVLAASDAEDAGRPGVTEVDVLVFRSVVPYLGFDWNYLHSRGSPEGKHVRASPPPLDAVRFTLSFEARKLAYLRIISFGV